tara:strand:+ start:1093 stop:1527 length:435 start_codon:yes stop_codon:yes gene_type:complete
MSIWSKLFGSDKVIEGVYNGLDKVVHTDEEKSDFWLKLLKAYEPFKIAQRYLALIMSISFVSAHLLAVLYFSFSLFFDPCASQISKDGELVGQTCKAQQLERGAEKIFDKNNEALGLPLALILSFYFGGGAAEGVARSIAGRKK